MPSLDAINSTAGFAAGEATKSASDELSDQFLTLLVAQMKNQTPTNPMDNSEFTSQLAQINTVSGISDLNKTLNSITSQIDSTQQLQASMLIGRNVLVPGDKVFVGDEGASTPFGFELPKGAGEVHVTIRNSVGEIVSENDFDNVSKGIETFSWDGKDTDGNTVPAGQYTVEATAKDLDGDDIDVSLLSMGHVNGLILGDEGPQLDLGPQGVVSLDEIRQIPSPYTGQAPSNPDKGTNDDQTQGAPEEQILG